MSTNDHIGVTAGAKLLGMTRRGVLAAIERGDLAATRIGGDGSPFIITLDEVGRFARERADRTSSAPDTTQAAPADEAGAA